MLRLINRSPRLMSAILSPGAPTIAMVIALALLLIALLLPGPASARPVRTQLELGAFGLVYSDGSYEYVFAGVIDPPRRFEDWSCLGGRQVRVYRDEPKGPDTLIGSRRTDGIGMALVRVKDPDIESVPGDYYAKVGDARKKSMDKAKRLKCQGARSSTLSVSAPRFHRVTASGNAAGREARKAHARQAIDG